MLVIAENINIMSKSIGPAMREMNAEPIQKLAIKLAENGADYLDINLGPARKGGPEMMEFIVKDQAKMFRSHVGIIGCRSKIAS